MHSLFDVALSHPRDRLVKGEFCPEIKNKWFICCSMEQKKVKKFSIMY